MQLDHHEPLSEPRFPRLFCSYFQQNGVRLLIPLLSHKSCPKLSFAYEWTTVKNLSIAKFQHASGDQSSPSAPDCQRSCYPHEVSDRFSPHLPQYAAAVDLYGDLGHSEFGSNLFVEEATSYPRHNLFLAMGKGLELCP
jgi:hypothetical protein